MGKKKANQKPATNTLEIKNDKKRVNNEKGRVYDNKNNINTKNKVLY